MAMTQKERTNEITLERKNYADEYDFWAAVANLIQILTVNDCMCVLYADRQDSETTDRITVEFNRSAPLESNFAPYWLTAEEIYEHERKLYEGDDSDEG